MIPLVALVLLVWLAPLTMEFIYAQKLTRYRIDLEPGEPFWRGKSFFFTQGNV